QIFPDQRGTGHAPLQILQILFFKQIMSPDFNAGSRFEAMENSRSADRVKKSLIESRRGPWPDASQRFFKAHFIFINPELITSLSVVADYDFDIAPLLLGK